MADELVHNRAAARAGLSTVMREFSRREILVKDFDRGLIDFPTLMYGREALLCWEKNENDIAWWHDIETGYDNRQPLVE